MFIDVLIILAVILLIANVLYAIYKSIWYAAKMLILKKKLKKLESKFINIKFIRPFYKMIFGAKGSPDFIMTRKGVSYEVSVITSISNRGRWNFEFAHDKCYLEIRRRPVFSRWTFDIYHTHEGDPEHSTEYRREQHFSRHLLEVSKSSERFEKQILLLYPKPKMLTCSKSKLEYLKPGDAILGHEIMYIGDFTELFP